MSDHRRLQRTLFRMQADAGFARAILQGDETALATTGLGDDDLKLLEAVDPRALSADPGSRRRTQIGGNAASEYLLTLAVAARAEGGGEFLDGFLLSSEFHAAMAHDERLPLAFGAYAQRWAKEHGAPAVGALAALELAMATLRRSARGGSTAPALTAGDVRLSARASVLRVPGGTLAASVVVREALDAGRAVGGSWNGELTGETSETLLLHVAEPPDPHRLANVQLERLTPPADELMLRAARTLSCVERAEFAREHGAEPDDLEAFLAPFVAEGVLVTSSG